MEKLQRKRNYLHSKKRKKKQIKIDYFLYMIQWLLIPYIKTYLLAP